jgi:hypothetical protein
VTKRLEYVGKIGILQGKTALIRDLDTNDNFLGFKRGTVLAQFDDMILFNGKNLGTKWSPFPSEDFREPGQKPIF